MFTNIRQVMIRGNITYDDLIVRAIDTGRNDQSVIGFAILEGNILAFNNELFGNIMPGGIVTTLVVYGLIAFLVYRRCDLNMDYVPFERAK